MPGLRFVLLGRFAMRSAGKALKFTAPPKTLPLLAYLLLHDGAPVRRERLAFALWPDAAEEAARADLRRHLYYLQRALPPPDGPAWLAIDAQTVAWNRDAAASTDVAEFVALSQSEDTLPDAVALYRGDLLEDVVAEEWLTVERERLRSIQFANLRALIVVNRIARDHGAALRYAEQTLAMDPWREDAVRHVMLLRNETGDRAGALAEFE